MGGERDHVEDAGSGDEACGEEQHGGGKHRAVGELGNEDRNSQRRGEHEHRDHGRSLSAISSPERCRVLPTALVYRGIDAGSPVVNALLTCRAHILAPWVTFWQSSVSSHSHSPCWAWSGRWNGYDVGPRGLAGPLRLGVHLPRRRHVPG